VPNGHHLVNRTSKPAVFLEVGDRLPGGQRRVPRIRTSRCARRRRAGATGTRTARRTSDPMRFETCCFGYGLVEAPVATSATAWCAAGASRRSTIAEDGAVGPSGHVLQRSGV